MHVDSVVGRAVGIIHAVKGKNIKKWRNKVNSTVLQSAAPPSHHMILYVSIAMLSFIGPSLCVLCVCDCVLSMMA